MSDVRSPSASELSQWESEFEAAARRPLRQRFRYAFIRTYKPVMDDATFRSFATTQEYRDWCEATSRAGWAMAGKFEYTQAEEIRGGYQSTPSM